MEADLAWLKRKEEAGAEYAVTQMFFDNTRYFEFVRQARAAGITLPIIPGIKPFGRLAQREALPRLFHLTLPHEMQQGLDDCRTDADATDFGVQWGIKQCRELLAAGVGGIHFYSMSAAESIRRIATEIY
jgi:methylenetetrahydrofolate reductase (NADPH)